MVKRAKPMPMVDPTNGKNALPDPAFTRLTPEQLVAQAAQRAFNLEARVGAAVLQALSHIEQLRAEHGVAFREFVRLRDALAQKDAPKPITPA